MAYATPADLRLWLNRDTGDVSEATRMLARAGEFLDIFLVGSTYSTDVNGMPTDAAVIAALNSASCAQVEYWLENGDEFGELERINNFAIEGISVQYRGPSPSLAPRARGILRVAGLMPSRTPIQTP